MRSIIPVILLALLLSLRLEDSASGQQFAYEKADLTHSIKDLNSALVERFKAASQHSTDWNDSSLKRIRELLEIYALIDGRVVVHVHHDR